jgi:hypothetical protein
VDVLENDDHRRPPPQLTRQRSDDLVHLATARDQLLELAPGQLGDVEQRSERAGSEERVARSPENARRAFRRAAEAA